MTKWERRCRRESQQKYRKLGPGPTTILENTLVAHYADELKKLQEHNAVLVISLEEFFYRVRAVVQFDDAEWVCDIGAEILKQLKEGPK